MIREAVESDRAFIFALAEIEPPEQCLILVTDYGGFFFDPVTPYGSIVEAHFFFHPKGRGKHAVQACKDALDYVFHAGVHTVIGRIPVEDRPAKLMARWAGLKSYGIAESMSGGPLVEWFEIRKDQCLLSQ